MDKKSTLDARFKSLQAHIPSKHYLILFEFYRGYVEAVTDGGLSEDLAIHNTLLFLDLIEEQFRHPFQFSLYHQKIRHPIDYYQFGNDFIRPLIDLEKSNIFGLEELEKIEKQLTRKENVIFLANHQIEPDPQVISILLQKEHPRLAEKIIYVAGERVVTDPLAIPFSMGCDLLCIYSKRYIDNPPELKPQKQLHNKNTMELMSRLLAEGGKAIYVAPSGGRDRRNGQGKIEVAPFDPQSVEMFRLMAKRADVPTYFYPLTLATYALLPPPETIQQELGETRSAKRCPVFLYFAPFF